MLVSGHYEQTSQLIARQRSAGRRDLRSAIVGTLAAALGHLRNWH
jgi:hypothetical protein